MVSKYTAGHGAPAAAGGSAQSGSQPSERRTVEYARIPKGFRMQSRPADGPRAGVQSLVTAGSFFSLSPAKYAGGEPQALPTVSTLKGGIFYWLPGPGFLGEYNMQFDRID